MNAIVNVVDAIMGSGKTTAMIRYINESPPERRFIFCTPYLEQVSRIVSSCPGRGFVAPEDQFMPKIANIKILLAANLNIATTHALFMLLDDEARELISDGNYTLIIDETMDIFGTVDITPYDARSVTREYCSEDEDGLLHWEFPEYAGKFDVYRQEIEAGVVYRGSQSSLLRMAKISTFEAFQEVFLLTYLFDGQLHKAYFQMHDWKFQMWFVEGDTRDTYRLTQEPPTPRPVDYGSLIDIRHHFRGEQLQTSGTAFSLNWYKWNCPEREQFKILRKHMSSFFRQTCGGSYDNVMWTSFKAYKNALAAPSYTRGFLHCAAKATNEYRHKTALAYPINRYVNPNIVKFVADHGAMVSQDDFALSEMVQWVWRSAIRDGKPITLYIPSDRMYQLFTGLLCSLVEGE